MNYGKVWKKLKQRKTILIIVLEINMKSQDNAKYVENVISVKDMIAFVCEDIEDCNHLTEVFKKQKNFSVNIVMAPDVPMSNFQSPPMSQEHKQCGLECYVIDLFNAPEPIMRYLCACYGIHRIPVTSKVVDRNSVEFILQTYSTFFSNNMMHSGKRSRYGNRNWSVKRDFITAKNLLTNTNDELQRNIENKCRNFEEQLREKIEQYEGYKADYEKKAKIQDKLRQERKYFQDKKKNIENLKSNYLQKSKFQQQLNPVTNEEEEEENRLRAKIKSINELRERMLCDLNVEFMNFNKAEKEIVITMLCINLHSKDLAHIRSANEDIQEKVKAIENQLGDIKKEYRKKKQQRQKLLEEIRTLGEEYSRYLQGSQPRPVEMCMEEIEQKINHIQAELNLNEDNEPLVNQYNIRKKKIELMEKTIANFQENVSKLRQIIQKKKKEWLQPLQYHIGNINNKFSHYFKELNFVGEISLDIPENPDDFTKYGLRINLKFHDDESSLSELSQTRHSGGECSVAAIIFILSLQELTEVPFRCIDEINQGMDSENERKIFQLICDSVADDRCSQYFLLTPKLLFGFEYPEDVVVHIIVNSPGLETNLDLKKHLAIAQSK